MEKINCNFTPQGSNITTNYINRTKIKILIVYLKCQLFL